MKDFERKLEGGETLGLFAPDPSVNLLPRDGVVAYHGPVLSLAEADGYFDALLRTVPWKRDEAVVFGKRLRTAREVAWFGDSGYSYTYSGATRQAIPWTFELQELKALVEQISGAAYNSCLANLYHHGGEGVGWHSDGEKTLARHGAIASLTFGAERIFRFKHKQTGETASLLLEHGSLLVMAGATQFHWLHSLPKTARIKDPRINLTFRTILSAEG